VARSIATSTNSVAGVSTGRETQQGVTVDTSEWDRRYRDPELVWTAQPNRFLVEQVAACPAT
jgi:hypothetical protein